jgi:hypothetical protein
MIYSSIFHQILYFLQEKYFWKFYFSENFNISENNMISVGLDWTGLDWTGPGGSRESFSE